MRELDDARYKAIGARIRDVRLQRNMSQAELAEKAFISVPHMSEVENGKTKLRLSTFVYITEALHRYTAPHQHSRGQRDIPR
mgnify:CR=1 FL=1